MNAAARSAREPACAGTLGCGSMARPSLFTRLLRPQRRRRTTSSTDGAAAAARRDATAAPAVPPAATLRRERRALLRLREERLRDLGGLALEMYRRDRFREDLLLERCAELIGLEARDPRARRVPRPHARSLAGPAERSLRVRRAAALGLPLLRQLRPAGSCARAGACGRRRRRLSTLETDTHAAAPGARRPSSHRRSTASSAGSAPTRAHDGARRRLGGLAERHAVVERLGPPRAARPRGRDPRHRRRDRDLRDTQRGVRPCVATGGSLTVTEAQETLTAPEPAPTTTAPAATAPPATRPPPARPRCRERSRGRRAAQAGRSCSSRCPRRTAGPQRPSEAERGAGRRAPPRRRPRLVALREPPPRLLRRLPRRLRLRGGGDERPPARARRVSPRVRAADHAR